MTERQLYLLIGPTTFLEKVCFEWWGGCNLLEGSRISPGPAQGQPQWEEMSQDGCWGEKKSSLYWETRAFRAKREVQGVEMTREIQTDFFADCVELSKVIIWREYSNGMFLKSCMNLWPTSILPSARIQTRITINNVMKVKLWYSTLYHTINYFVVMCTFYFCNCYKDRFCLLWYIDNLVVLVRRNKPAFTNFLKIPLGIRKQNNNCSLCKKGRKDKSFLFCFLQSSS